MVNTWNDQTSGLLAAASTAAPHPTREWQTPLPNTDVANAANADVLSDVLRVVKLSGALFFLTDAAAPWRVEVPAGSVLAPLILRRSQHIISYHIVTRGSCWGELRGEPAIALQAGDIIVFPHGDPYAMSKTPSDKAEFDSETTLAVFRLMADGGLPFAIREGGDGPDRLHLVCGFLGCDLRPFNPLLATLPRLLLIRQAMGPAPDMLGQLIELTLAEAHERRAGSECIRLRLSELMFVEVVRRYVGSLASEQTGWLAGLRDPLVGRALILLHQQPARPWTLVQLATAVGLSRSAFSERFTQLVGQPPMQYLMHWRMQLAARMLSDSPAKVSAVGLEVGYASEAAFSRTFKKIAGVAPAVWRERAVAGN